MTVVGIATTGAESRELVNDLRPDLILVDIGLPMRAGSWPGVGSSKSIPRPRSSR
jgi:AmiR/NasT family two-component response regulator